MIKRTFLTVLFLCSTLAVDAQVDPNPTDEPLVCQRDAQGYCQWVPDQSNRLSEPLVSDPQGLIENGSTQVFYDWVVRDPREDPGLKLPGFCAKNPEFARYRWQEAMQTGDLNRLIAAYDWTGQSDDSAIIIVDRLQTIPRAGVWEKGTITYSSGNRDLSHVKAPWRWIAEGQITYLTPVKRMDCWFLVFTHEPDAEIDAPALSNQDLEPQIVDPGVYQF